MKEKKPSVWAKIKAKIDKIFENDDLTFLGQIYMLGIYVIPGIVVILLGLGVGTEMVECLLKASGIEYNFHFGALYFILVFTFMIDICALIGLTVAETYNVDNEMKSLLTKEPEKEK